MNFFSAFTNITSIGAYFFLQKTHNIFIYTIFCLINSILFVIRGIMFKDYACCIAEIFWIGLSIYGIVKIINDK